MPFFTLLLSSEEWHSCYCFVSIVFVLSSVCCGVEFSQWASDMENSWKSYYCWYTYMNEYGFHSREWYKQHNASLIGSFPAILHSGGYNTLKRGPLVWFLQFETGSNCDLRNRRSSGVTINRSVIITIIMIVAAQQLQWRAAREKFQEFHFKLRSSLNSFNRLCGCRRNGIIFYRAASFSRWLCWCFSVSLSLCLSCILERRRWSMIASII